MPFCPKCRNEYIDGAVTCDDCGVGLVGSIDDIPQREKGNGDLVEAWHTHGEMDGQMIRAMLESNGIEAVIVGESLRLTHGFTVDGLAEVRILVRDDDAERARDIISSLDGMTRCESCGYPVYVKDETCHSCGKPITG